MPGSIEQFAQTHSNFKVKFNQIKKSVILAVNQSPRFGGGRERSDSVSGWHNLGETSRRESEKNLNKVGTSRRNSENNT